MLILTDLFTIARAVIYDYFDYFAAGTKIELFGAGRLIRFVIISNIIGSWLYYTLMESSKWQATLGKMALGIVVVDEQGARISLGIANKRYWGKIISGLTLYIGYIMVLFTEERQALHDKIAGTYVVDKEKHRSYIAARAQKIDSNIAANKVG
ncbi:RDD family protein [compost metagenome]